MLPIPECPLKQSFSLGTSGNLKEDKEKSEYFLYDMVPTQEASFMTQNSYSESYLHEGKGKEKENNFIPMCRTQL